MKMRRNFNKMFDEAEIDFLREELRSRLWHHKEQVRILENDIDIYNGKIPNPHKFEMTCTKEQMNNLLDKLHHSEERLELTRELINKLS